MKLVRILSDSVQIRTNLLEFKDIRINDLLSVSDGVVSLVTMVTGLTIQIPRSGSEKRIFWERSRALKPLIVPLSGA